MTLKDVFRKAAKVVMALVILTPVIANASDEDEHFEVAAIHPSQYGRGPTMGVNSVTGRFMAQDMKLQNLITVAYGITDGQIQAPKWIRSSYYTIEAKPKFTNTPRTYSQEMGMLRRLLEDRFMLRAHWENREQDGIALVLIPGKHLLREPDQDKHSCDGNSSSLTMSMLRAEMEREFEKPVANLTGLSGMYCIGLRWQALDGTSRAIGVPSDAQKNGLENEANMTLVTALRKQLGINPQPQRVQVRILIVDSIQQPSPN